MSELARSTWVIARRGFAHMRRQPEALADATIQPIMFVLLFAYVFGGAISPSLPRGVTYINYLLPGILIQSVTFRASMTALGLSDDLKLGVIDRFRTMPMARSAVLVGRTAADLIRNVLIIGLMILIGYIIGFRFQAGVVQAIGSIVLVSAFGLALSWIFAFVALIVRSAEAAQSAGFVILFPLVFASSVFVPVSSMPDWLEAFAKVSPVTLTADAARSLALVPGTPSTLGGSIAWIAGILAVFVPLSVWRYRRMT
jgi:ABC transporter DrrB family efflux protein